MNQQVILKYLFLMLTLGECAAGNALAMEAISSLSIQGRAPILNSEIENRLNFQIDQTVNTTLSGVVEVSPHLAYSAFTPVKPIFTATDFFDDDGDVYDTVTYDEATLVWLDTDGNEISYSSSATLGCDSGTNSVPNFLEIVLSNVQVLTKYGDPNKSVKVNWRKRFELSIVGDGICYIRPNSLHVNSNAYDATQFVPSQGFKVSAGFPTTGFKGGEFKLVMVNTDNLYNWSYPSFLKPVITTTTGTGADITSSLNPNNTSHRSISFRFINDIKPAGGTHSITATNKVTGETYRYQFTFKSERFWFVPKLLSGGQYPGSAINWQAAMNACSTAQRPLRKDLTNSIYNTVATGSGSWPNLGKNIYERATGTVFSEWGETTGRSGGGNVSASYPYQHSEWVDGYFWTKELYALETQERYNSYFIVYSNHGNIGISYNNPGGDGYTVCVQ